MDVVLGKINGKFLNDYLNRSRSRCKVIRAAVAYAQPANALFDHCKQNADVRLVFYGLLDETGAVPAHLLKSFLDRGPSRVECRLVRGHYHPKVIWWEGFGAYIGSANLTLAAWTKNVECGVFYSEDELVSLGIADELDALFDYTRTNSVPLTNELLAKLSMLAESTRELASAQKQLQQRFDEIMSDVAEHKGTIVVPPRGVVRNRRRERFVKEWSETLQLLRGLTLDFLRLKKRPVWVVDDAVAAIHFDQFLHAYYYSYVREGIDADDEDDASSRAQVEAAYEQNRADPQRALVAGASWWASRQEAPYGEDEFIATIGPNMTRLFSKESLASMDEARFCEAMSTVNAFRARARQVGNHFFGLPPTHHESIDERVTRLAKWLWSSPDARTASGRSAKDVLEFVIWGAQPGDMEERLWLVTNDPEWRIRHLGMSTFGEVVGWARPDMYPPRNNRTNKALRALGYDVTVHGD